MWKYSSYELQFDEKKKSKFSVRAEGVKTIGVRNIKKQEQDVSVGQHIPISAHARNPIADGLF